MAIHARLTDVSIEPSGVAFNVSAEFYSDTDIELGGHAVKAGDVIFEAPSWSFSAGITREYVEQTISAYGRDRLSVLQTQMGLTVGDSFAI